MAIKKRSGPLQAVEALVDEKEKQQQEAAQIQNRRPGHGELRQASVNKQAERTVGHGFEGTVGSDVVEGCQLAADAQR